MQFTASNIYESFNNWKAGVEVSRRIDPVRKVFSLLTNLSSIYDIRTDVADAYGVYNYSIIYDPEGVSRGTPYPIIGAGLLHLSLPLFDIWRYLNQYEFHEFISSFRDSLFQKLMSGKYRGVQLFYMPVRFPEKSYLRKFIPGSTTWEIDVDPFYAGNINNPRNRTGLDSIEDFLFMDTPEERDC